MGFSLIYVCFVTHILSLNPCTFFILIGCCTYYDNSSIRKKSALYADYFLPLRALRAASDFNFLRTPGLT